MKRKKLIPKWTPFQRAVLSHDPNENRRLLIEANTDEVWINSRYTAHIKYLTQGFVHLSVKRNDRSPIHDWRDLQRIKSELIGPEREAVEVYPAESRLVDGSNQYHLWVYPEGVQCVFGFFSGRMVDDRPLVGERQRPFEDLTPEQRKEMDELHARLYDYFKTKGMLVPNAKREPEGGE